MFKHGSGAVVYIDGTDISSYLTSANLAISVNASDHTVLNRQPWTRVVRGKMGATFDIAGLYDPTEAESPVLMLVTLAESEDPVSVEYYPGGYVVGQLRRQFSGVVTSFTESTPVGGLVSFSATLTVSGPVETEVIGIVPA